MPEWFLARGGMQYGPYPETEIERLCDDGRIAGDDLVWREGMSEWEPARRALARFLRPPPSSRRDRESDWDRERREHFDLDDRREVGARRPRPRSEFPGRLISPSALLLVMLLFPLPWIDIHCQGLTIASQSGLQACWGGYSVNTPDPRFAALEPQLRRQDAKDKVSAAPLVIISIALVVLGFIMGLALPVGWLRFSLVAGCSGWAFFLLLVQSMSGFPLAKKVEESNREMARKMPQEMRKPNPFFAGEPRIRVSTTPWFWTTMVLLLAPTGLLFVEHYAVFPERFRRHTLD